MREVGRVEREGRWGRGPVADAAEGGRVEGDERRGGAGCGAAGVGGGLGVVEGADVVEGEVEGGGREGQAGGDDRDGWWW